MSKAMTPTPPNAGEPVAWRFRDRTKNGRGWKVWHYTDGVPAPQHLAQQEVQPLYIHPQPNAGVVTDVAWKEAMLDLIDRLGGERYSFTQFGNREVTPNEASDEIYDLVLQEQTRTTTALSAAPKPECTIVHSEDPSAPAYLALGAVKVTRERCG